MGPHRRCQDLFGRLAWARAPATCSIRSAGTASNYGLPVIAEDELRDAVIRADHAGIAVAIHAIGDRANRTVLDAIENAHRHAARHPSSAERRYLVVQRLPHRIEHAQHLAASDVARFAALERRRLDAAGTCNLRLSGRRAVAGCRSAVPGAMPGVHCRIQARFWPLDPMHRSKPSIRGPASMPPSPAGEPGSHRVAGIPNLRSRSEALEAYAIGPAAASGERTSKAHSKPGSLADLLVLTADPYDVEPQSLWQMGSRPRL